MLMKVKNIWKNVEPPLEMHKDDRGDITDIIYNEKFTHMTIINSVPGALRGNHYHKESEQWILVTKGSMVYDYRDNPEDTSGTKSVEVFEGDLVYTPPMEVHALRIGKVGCQFITFGRGKRAGKDYESDTFRVPSIFPKDR